MGRLLRFTTRLALLAAVGYAIKRLLEARPPVTNAPGWNPVEPPAGSATVPPPSTPVVPMVEAEVIEVGDVDRPGEPEVDTAAAAEPPAKAPVKKAAAKKAPAKKAPAKATAKKALAKKATAKKASPIVPPEDPVQ
jgi:hypothetical protein